MPDRDLTPWMVVVDVDILSNSIIIICQSGGCDSNRRLGSCFSVNAIHFLVIWSESSLILSPRKQCRLQKALAGESYPLGFAWPSKELKPERRRFCREKQSWAEVKLELSLSLSLSLSVSLSLSLCLNLALTDIARVQRRGAGHAIHSVFNPHALRSWNIKQLFLCTYCTAESQWTQKDRANQFCLKSTFLNWHYSVVVSWYWKIL